MITAIVPAAGLSTRMGGDVSKPLLPWGKGTIIEQVVSTLFAAGVSDVVVVTGHRREAIEAALAAYPVRCVFNPALRTAKCSPRCKPACEPCRRSRRARCWPWPTNLKWNRKSSRRSCRAFASGGSQAIVVPSYQMRRGHPILLPRWLWQEVLDLAPGDSLRSVINRHTAAIQHLVVDTPSVLADVDTPVQYQQALNEQRP